MSRCPSSPSSSGCATAARPSSDSGPSTARETSSWTRPTPGLGGRSTTTSRCCSSSASRAPTSRLATSEVTAMSSPRLLSLSLLVLLASACATPAPDTLRKIRETGSVTLGYRESSPPFSSLGDGGKPVGYSIDLCARGGTQVQAVTGRSDLQIKGGRVTPEA